MTLQNGMYFPFEKTAKQALTVRPSRARPLSAARPPPCRRVMGEPLVFRAEVKHFAKGLPATQPPCNASAQLLSLFQNSCCRFELSCRLWRIMADSFFLFLFSFAALGEKCVLSQPQANAPALFFFSIFTLRSVSLLSPPSFCKVIQIH